MKALVVTNMLPTPDHPHLGTFVGDQITSLRSLAVEVDVVHVRRTEHGAGVYRSLGRELRQRAAAGDFDVVHVMYGGVMARTAVRAGLGVPVVVSFCGSDLLGIRNGNLRRRLRARAGVTASHRAARSAAGVIVKSVGLRAALPSGLDEERVWTIPNGVDLDRFAPVDRREARQALGWPLDERVVLFPGSPARPEKRFALARAAVDALEREVPPVRLQALERVAHADVPLWLSAADVVILTSTHEGSPNVVKEALACCVPVVSVDVGDVRERISGVSGASIAGPQPETLAAALQRALATERSDSGRRRVADLSLGRVAERIVAVYDAVATAGPTGP